MFFLIISLDSNGYITFKGTHFYYFGDEGTLYSMRFHILGCNRNGHIFQWIFSIIILFFILISILASWLALYIQSKSLDLLVIRIRSENCKQNSNNRCSLAPLLQLTILLSPPSQNQRFISIHLLFLSSCVFFSSFCCLLGFLSMILLETKHIC